MSAHANVSDDLIWECVRNQNAFLVKRKTGGGAWFSRDEFNLMNRHSRTQSGFVNSKGVSIQPNGDKGVTLKTKKTKDSHKVASSINKHSYKSSTSNQKIYKNIASAVGKKSYRSDLNQAAVARASAILDSQRAKSDAPASKPRGAAAKKA